MKTLATFLAFLWLLIPAQAQRVSDLPELFEIDTNDLFVITVPGVAAHKATFGTLVSNLNGVITVTATVTNAVASGSNMAVTNSTSFGIFYRVENLTNMQFFNVKQGSNIVMYRDGSNVVFNSSASAVGGLAVGKTIYLDSSFGNDATATRTNAAFPYATASNAVAAILTGDTLVVRAGTYMLNPKISPTSGGNLNASVAITNKSNFRITGEPGAIWQMSSRSTNFGQSSAPMLILVGCTNVMIDRMTFIGFRTNGVSAQDFAIALQNCGGVTIDGCVFDDWNDQAISDFSPNNINSDVEIRNNWFTDIGNTNHVTLGVDGTAVGINCSNLWIHHNHFRRNLRDFELYEQAICRDVVFENNESYAVREKAIVLITDSNRLSNVAIRNNLFFGGATNAISTSGQAILMEIRSVSNLVFQGNLVDGFEVGPTYGYGGTVNNSICVDVQIYDNTFCNMGLIGLYMARDRATAATLRRVSIMRNKFENILYQGITFNGEDSRVEDNEFQDCNGAGDNGGVIMIGHTSPAATTNSTNITIIGNKIYTRFWPNTATGIVMTALSYSNVVWGNEVHRGYAGTLHDSGVGTMKMPLHPIGKGKLLYSDTNSRLAEVTVSPASAFNGVTGTLTTGGAPGGAGGGEIQFGVAGALVGTNRFLYDITNNLIRLIEDSGPYEGHLIIRPNQIIQGDTDAGLALGVSDFDGVPVKSLFLRSGSSGWVGIGTLAPAASLDNTGKTYTASVESTNYVAVGSSSGAAGKLLLYDANGTITALIAPGITRAVTNYATGDTNHGIWVSVRVAPGENIITNLFGVHNQVLTWSGSAPVWKDANAFDPVLLAGHAISGSATTNFTLFAPTNEMVIGVSTNLSITASMIYDPAKVHYWSLNITNGSGNNQTLAWRQETNAWRWSGAYGTNSPSVMTNNTRLLAAARQQGTNIVVGYTYFPWP